MALPGWLFSVGSRFSPAARVIRMAGMGDQLDAARQAAAEARTAVTDLIKDAEPGNLATFFTMSSSAAKEFSTMNALSDAVPNVARIEVPKALAIGLMGVERRRPVGQFHRHQHRERGVLDRS